MRGRRPSCRRLLRRHSGAWNVSSCRMRGRRIHRWRPDAASTPAIPSERSAADGNWSKCGATGTARAPLAFTPRRPRLSNPSISNATASGHRRRRHRLHRRRASKPRVQKPWATPCASHRRPKAKAAPLASRVLNGATDEFGRIAGGDALSPSQETVRLGQLRADRVPGRAARASSTLLHRSSTRCVPATASRSGAHTMMHTESAADPSTSPSRPQPPPRPPRHIKRPSEEQLGSPARRSVLEDMGTPRQTPRIQQDEHLGRRQHRPLCLASSQFARSAQPMLGQTWG